MLIRVHTQPGAANAVACVLHRPAIDAGCVRALAGSQVLAGVVAAAIPPAPPRRAVAVLFVRVDGIAQPVSDIRVPPLAQDDPLAMQRRQREQR